MIGSTPLHATRRAGSVFRALLRGDAAMRAADVMLGVLGVVAAVALCKSFLDWFNAPLDSSSAIALLMIIAFVASFVWFLRFVLHSTLRPQGPTQFIRAGAHGEVDDGSTE